MTAPTEGAVDVEELPEPCYGCECCGLWQRALQTLRDQIGKHVAGEIRVAPCDPECLVCAEVDWQGPPVPDDAERAQMRRQLLAGVELGPLHRG